MKKMLLLTVGILIAGGLTSLRHTAKKEKKTGSEISVTKENEEEIDFSDVEHPFIKKELSLLQVQSN